MQAQTTGTWIVIAANCVLAIVGVLQAVDWIHLVGSQTAGWVTMVIAAANAFAHYYTGESVKK
jgi:hypothetical protein